MLLLPMTDKISHCIFVSTTVLPNFDAVECSIANLIPAFHPDSHVDYLARRFLPYAIHPYDVGKEGMLLLRNFTVESYMV